MLLPPMSCRCCSRRIAAAPGAAARPGGRCSCHVCLAGLQPAHRGRAGSGGPTREAADPCGVRVRHRRVAGSSFVNGLRTVPWLQGWWLNRPPHVAISQGRLIVKAARGSDAWRTTSYGFVRDNAHALLSDLPDGWAVQVSFLADFAELYDQAGVFVRIDETCWTKAGVEFSDGALQASSV